MTRDSKASRSLLETRISTRGALWGREEQASKLELLSSQIAGEQHNHSDHDTDAEKKDCDGERNCQCQIAIIHGPSGCGKTQIAKQLSRNNEKTTFLFGKFDQYSDNAMPYSALVQAFGSLFDDAEQSETNDNGTEDSGLLALAQESLGAEARVLAGLVPSLCPKAGKWKSANESPSEELPVMDEDSGSMKMAMGSERLAVAVVAFLQSICRPEHPVILAIDDLQYADEDTLTVLHTIATHSSEIDHLLLLAIYRDDTPTETLNHFIQALKQEADVHDIAFSNLTDDQVSEFVSDILALEHEEESLSEFVALLQRRTQGNPHFLLEFLYMLQRHQLLTFDWAANKWTWDIASIQANTKMTENVVAVLTQKVQQLPPTVLRMLQVASGLGFVFELKLLELLYDMTYDHCSQAVTISSILPGSEAEEHKSEVQLSFPEMIDLAMHENIIEQGAHGTYRFCHDKLQEALYSLIPPSEGRDMMHWFAGMYVKHAMVTDSKSRSRYIFLATDQLNRGSACISNESERYALIQMNYDASLEAKARNGLDLVGVFLTKALELTKESDWQSAYDLTLKVFNFLVEYESSTNHLKRGLDHVSVILKHAKEKEDCIVAIASKARIHMVRAEYATSIRYCREALSLCGEKVPSFFPFFAFLGELRQAKRIIKGKTDEELVDIPEMTDPHKRSAVKVLFTLATCGWQVSPTLMRFACVRLFTITMKHGQHKVLGTALGALGAVLSQTSDKDTAIRLATLALKSEEKNDPATIIMTHASCLHLTVPIASITESLLLGYRKGLENGDTFFGGACLTEYTLAYLDSGLRLQSLAADLEHWTVQLKILKRDVFLAFTVPVMLLAQNLTGQSSGGITWTKVTTYLNGPTQVGTLNNVKMNLLYTQMFKGYIFRSQEEVEASLKQIFRLPRQQIEGSHFHNNFINVLNGLVGFWLFSRTKKWRYRRMALRTTRWFRKNLNLNSIPLRMLLEAHRELLVIPVDVEKVRQMFDDVVLMFRRSGQSQFAAIGLESAGDFLSSEDEYSTAQHYYTQAACLYREWGAQKKVEQLVETYGLRSEEIKEAGSTLRGQERYSIRDAISPSIKHFIE